MNDLGVYVGFATVLIAIIIISIVAFMKVKNTSSYFVAGRQAPWYLIVGSLMSSTISGAAFLGILGNFYTQGASVFWILLGCSWGLFIMCFFIGPKLRRFGKVTIPEYLSERFDSPLLKPLFSLLVTIWMVILMGTLYVQGGLLFESMFGANYETSVIIIGIISVLVTIFGGMISVLNSDFFSMFILILVAIIVFPFILNSAGGWGEVTNTVTSADPEFFKNTSHIGFFASLSLLIIWTLGYVGHPGFLTRFYTAKNVREIIKAGIGISVIYLPFWIFIFIVAVSAKVLYPNIGDPETIWISSLFDYAPPIIAGLGLATILAGILSSVNTWLLTAATSTIRDVYQVVINQNASQKKILNYSRLFVFILGSLSIPIGVWRPGSIIEMMNIAYAVAASAGGIVILTSMYYKKMTKQAAWAGIISGASIAIIWRTGQLLEILTDAIDPIIPTGVISLALIFIVSNITSPTEKIVSMYNSLKNPKFN